LNNLSKTGGEAPSPKPLTPLRDLVFVKPDDAVEIRSSSGAIILAVDAESTAVKSKAGTVVACGPGKCHEKTGVLIPMTVKPGDRVLLNKMTGLPFEYNREKLLAVLQRDIEGVIE